MCRVADDKGAFLAVSGFISKSDYIGRRPPKSTLSSACAVKPCPDRENLTVWESSQLLSQPIGLRVPAEFESPRIQDWDLAPRPKYGQAWWCKPGPFRSSGPSPSAHSASTPANEHR